MFQIGDKAKKGRSCPQERYRPSSVLCHRQKINLPTQHKQPGVSGEVSFFMWTHTTSKQVVYYHTTSDRVSQERCCVSCDPCHNHFKQITNIPQVVSQVCPTPSSYLRLSQVRLCQVKSPSPDLYVKAVGNQYIRGYLKRQKLFNNKLQVNRLLRTVWISCCT